LHEAPLPHCVSATFWSLMTAVGEQMSAHDLLPSEPVSAHCGTAVTPAGTSVGHVEEVQ
jgi:hypothetical protein